MEPIDVVRLRGILAERKISRKQLALASNLHSVYVGRVLAGSIIPGELGRIRLARGLAALGLDGEMQRAS